MFDPFCRCKRIKFCGFDTTVGQLNFFEWALTDEVLDYLEANKDQVHEDMDNRLQELKQTPEKNRRRHELSRSATKSLTQHNVKINVKFD